MGRPAGLPKVPGSGRVKKSLDRQARALVSAELAGSILSTFERIGGTDDMVKWAKANRSIFYTQILSRLMPPPQRDDADFVQNNLIVSEMSDLEAARRIAFVLASAVHPNPSVNHDPVAERVPVDISPQEALDNWQPTPEPLLKPEPVEDLDPDRARWVEELPLTPEQRRDALLVRNTVECTLETYVGSSAEQTGPVQRQVTRKPTAAELCYRRNKLL